MPGVLPLSVVVSTGIKATLTGNVWGATMECCDFYWYNKGYTNR